MYVLKLKGGGELRVKDFGRDFTLGVVNENGKGVAVGLAWDEASALSNLILHENPSGFEEEDTGTIDISELNDADSHL